MLFKTYLERYAFKERWITVPPSEKLGMVLVIPSYQEAELPKTLGSIIECHEIKAQMEVIIVINTSESDDRKIIEQSAIQFDQIKTWGENHSTKQLTFHPIWVKDIPYKQAGPGYARKAGMDEAVRRFSEIQNERGIIVSLDADCTVEPNYLTALESHWSRHQNTNGVDIYFEHPLENRDQKINDGIVKYELHLRYYIHAQRYCGFPHAYHTIGSCFAVSASAYARQGGMNKRKAGEDFYFLHKIIPLGEFHELNETCVYPSSRSSFRVPFGTGRTMKDFLEQKEKQYLSYHFQTFSDLRVLLQNHQYLYRRSVEQIQDWTKGLPGSIRHFLDESDFYIQIPKINENTSNPETFKKAFFGWFDAFRLMKFVHFSRDNYYPNKPIKEVADEYVRIVHRWDPGNLTEKELLLWFRKYDAKAGRKDC